jgi:thymidine phosphorylase
VAACGGYVPMISGRGLGHTGGTLDKLDAVPGYVTQPRTSSSAPCARSAAPSSARPPISPPPTSGSTPSATSPATVESIPLITASILSKKLAAGLHGLVMDVKIRLRRLHARLRRRGRSPMPRGGRHRRGPADDVALLTAMDEPLAPAAGNALEVAYAPRPPDRATARAALPRRHRGARRRNAAARAAGARHRRSALGEDRARLSPAVRRPSASPAWSRRSAGRHDLLEQPEQASRPRADRAARLPGGRGGTVSGHRHPRRRAGRGRARRRAHEAPQDPIDHAVGITDLVGLGEAVGPDRPLGIVHARDEAGHAMAERRLREAYRLGEGAPRRGALIAERITESSNA